LITELKVDSTLGYSPRDPSFPNILDISVTYESPVLHITECENPRVYREEKHLRNKPEPKGKQA